MRRSLSFLALSAVLLGTVILPRPASAVDPYTNWGINELNLPAAWSKIKGNANICVADVGVEVNHPDLRAFPVTDPLHFEGGNLRLHLSYDFRNNSDDACADELESESHPLSYAPCDGVTYPDMKGTGGTDNAGHGTHTSGIVAANVGNGIGAEGACPHCSLIMSAMNTTSVILPKSFNWGVDRGAQVLSGSLGIVVSPTAQVCPPANEQDPWRALCDSLALAEARDVVMVFAVGNNLGPINFPARYPGSIAVGGLGQDGSVWHRDPCPSPDGHTECGSNFGPSLALIAPAENVLSTTYEGRQWNSDCGDDPSHPGYGLCTGTSMSTPFVAGIAGLVRSANPLLSRADVRDILLRSADQWPNRTDDRGYGVPDASVAVSSALGTAAGQVLTNRLTPLFALYSPTAQDYLFTTIPQVASSAIAGYLEERCATAEGRPSCPTIPYQPADFGQPQLPFPPVPGYSAFPGVTGAPRASVYVLTSDRSPFPSFSLVPLYRMTYRSGSDSRRDSTYVTDETAIVSFKSGSTNVSGHAYELDGIEGYVYAPCSTAGCRPSGTVKLYRVYSASRADFAVVSELDPAIPGYDYTTKVLLGYAYANQDADGDSVIDGFEALIGTDPNRADSDCDGIGDGVEVLHYPYGDPLSSSGCGSAPTPADDSYSTLMNTSFQFRASELLINDTDPDLDPLFFDGLVTLPSHGTLSVDGAAPEDIIYRYTPTSGFTGSDSFDYRVADPTGRTGTAHVLITVADTSTFSPTPDVFTTPVNTYIQILASQLLSNDGTSAHFIRAENPLHGTVSTSIGPEDFLCTFVPDPGFVGQASFEYLVSPNSNGTEPYTRVSVTITVADWPPTANLTASCSGLTCNFSSAGSTDDVGIVSRAWTLGDGTTFSGVSTTKTYAVKGDYTVTLTVTDGRGQSDTVSRLVSVDALPVAAFTVNCTGRTCTFNGSGSTDDVGITAYAWNFGDGQTGSGVNATHTYATSGNFQVTLTVTDTFNQTDSEGPRTVSIDLNPTACFTAVRDGLVITFNASCSTDDLGIASYAWSFGDATTGTGQNISHTYATSGARTVQLTVTDTGGHTATTSQSVNPDAKPVASFTWSCTQRTCNFNGTGSTDNQPIAGYAWNFGDGTTGSGATPSRIYSVGGPYNVTLTVTDSVGQTNAKTNAVAVKRPPIAVNDSVSTPPNTAIDINVLANDSDPDNDALTVTGLTTPAHGIVSLNGNGTVHYTPAAGYLGTDTFQYRAQDAQDVSNLATVTVTTNNPPDARDDGWSTYQNGPTNIPFSHMLSNDFDPNGDTVTLASFNTAGLTGTLDCSSGTWCRYTPPSWFVGTTSFVYTASDGKGGTDTATVRIKVAVTNNAPVPQTDTLETTRNVALPFTLFTLLANDSDPDGDVLSVTQIILAPLTKFGTVTCTTPIYNCTYTPAAGFTGVDTVSYRVSDGITFTDGQIRFVVKPPTPAVLDAREDQIFTTTNPTYISYTLLTSNDYDPAGGGLTVVSVDTTGLLGTLDCTTYTTGCDYYRGTNDPTRFKYTVRNAQGTLDTTTVTLKPGNQSFNHAPVPANDVMTTAKNVAKSFSIFDVLRNDYDSDNDQLNVSFNFATPNGHVSCTSPAYFCTYTPNANFTGTDTLTYWANDGTNSASATVTMTVTP